MNTNIESTVACCGFYCDDCWINKQNVADLAAEVLKKVKSTEFKQLANGLPKMISIFKGLSSYSQFIEVLESTCFIRCDKNCKEDGGFPNCKIRECCHEKDRAGCWECEEYINCEKLAWIEPVHSDAAKKNIETIRSSGIDGYLKGEKYW